MINNFKIKNFKCFDDFEINNLGKINIILGDNNVGKSTLLEAIFGYCCGANLTPFIDNSIFRMARNSNINLYSLTERLINTFNNKKDLNFVFEGDISEREAIKYEYSIIPNNTILGELDSNFNSTTISIEENQINDNFINIGNTKIHNKVLFKIDIKREGKIENSQIVKFPLYMEMPSNVTPLFNGHFMHLYSLKDPSSITKIYSLLKRNPEEFKLFIEELNKAFKDDIEFIDMFPYPDGTPSPISIKIKGKDFIPLYEFGEGMQKWISLIGTQLIQQKSIHCIEEIGDMLHPEAQGALGLNLSIMSKKYGNQIFATTQSLEFVQNYLEALGNSLKNKKLLNDIRIITLKKINGSVKARVLEGDKALNLLVENKMELR